LDSHTGSGFGFAHRFGFATCAAFAAEPMARPLANSATARFSGSARSEPCACILPLVSEASTDSGVNIRNISRGTARGAFGSAPSGGAVAPAFSITLTWQAAQTRLKAASPVPACGASCASASGELNPAINAAAAKRRVACIRDSMFSGG
jgi:hypothetical protein